MFVLLDNQLSAVYAVVKKQQYSSLLVNYLRILERIISEEESDRVSLREEFITSTLSIFSRSSSPVLSRSAVEILKRYCIRFSGFPGNATFQLRDLNELHHQTPLFCFHDLLHFYHLVTSILDVHKDQEHHSLSFSEPSKPTAATTTSNDEEDGEGDLSFQMFIAFSHALVTTTSGERKQILESHFETLCRKDFAVFLKKSITLAIHFIRQHLFTQ